MLQHDLSLIISQYLDRHLIFPLIEFKEQYPSMQGVYRKKDLLQAKWDVLSKTNMVDFALEIFYQLHPEANGNPPEDMVRHREKVLLVLQTLEMECSPLLKILADPELLAMLKEANHFNIQYLFAEYEISADILESLYDYARFQFDCGNYLAASELLSSYIQLADGQHPDREFFAQWGRLASSILTQNWDAALENLLYIRDVIDSQGTLRPIGGLVLDPLQVLQQRTWLIHWSLFVFFNHPNGRNLIIDFFLADPYLNTIQTNCPHVLRYLAVAVITNKGRRNTLKDMIRVIKEESHNYKDPITEFIECLYVNFDFDGAQDTLKRCEDTLKRDFFLVGTVDDFLENARLTIFETYCRIHQVIDIGMLSGKLHMDRDAAERWVVNLVKNAKMDAKIDSEANQVIMGTSVPSIYEQVVEVTKGLVIRTNALAIGYDRRDGSYGGRDDGGRGRGRGRGGYRGGRGGGSSDRYGSGQQVQQAQSSQATTS